VVLYMHRDVVSKGRAIHRGPGLAHMRLSPTTYVIPPRSDSGIASILTIARRSDSLSVVWERQHVRRAFQLDDGVQF